MATPKSTRERVLRKVRHVGTKRFRHPNMLGRVTPKKTGNNDPRRGGNRLDIQDDRKRTLLFLGDLMHMRNRIEEEINGFTHKRLLLDMINHCLAVSMGGWRQDGDKFINESGHTASPKNWILDGNKLKSLAGNIINFNIEKLHNIRDICERVCDRT